MRTRTDKFKDTTSLYLVIYMPFAPSHKKINGNFFKIKSTDRTILYNVWNKMLI